MTGQFLEHNFIHIFYDMDIKVNGVYHLFWWIEKVGTNFRLALWTKSFQISWGGYIKMKEEDQG